MTSPSEQIRARRKRRWPILLSVVLGIGGAIVGLFVFVGRETSLIEVEGGEPRMAASDEPALRSLLAGGETTSQLEAAGRAFKAEAGIQGRVLRVDSSSSCRGAGDIPIQVKLLSGVRRGETVWLCFSDVRFLHPLP